MSSASIRHFVDIARRFKIAGFAPEGSSRHVSQFQPSEGPNPNATRVTSIFRWLANMRAKMLSADSGTLYAITYAELFINCHSCCQQLPLYLEVERAPSTNAGK